MIHNPELIKKLEEALLALDDGRYNTAFSEVRDVKEALQERVRKTVQGRR